MAIAKLASGAQPAVGTVRHCSVCLAVFRTDFARCPTDGGELVLATVDPLIRTIVADTYVIEAMIGEGAMGRVYRAHHARLENHRYAIKVLIGDLAASSTMRLRFEREAQNASRLDHPNVVNVIDFGKTDRGVHYLVMDLVEGSSLAEITRLGPMPAERVIRLAHQLCEGLDHAHERGVIHRDFKSDNILVVPAGGRRGARASAGREIARIADFGLAMFVEHDVRLTTSGVACTPAYAAPEQLRGGPIDHRVDLYGLGVTLFEMLSGGYLPFEGDLDATIAAKMSYEAPSVLTRAPNVPPGLVTLVSRLLAHEPEHRPSSARAVIRALETSMTLPRPPLRTLDMRPIAKRRTVRRSRWVKIKGALLAASIAAMASWPRDGAEPAHATLPHVAVAAAEPAPPVLVDSPEPMAVAAEPPTTRFADVLVADLTPPAAVPLALPEEVPAAREQAARAAAARRARHAAARRHAAHATRAMSVEPSDGPSALEVATRYSAIGRRLAALDESSDTAAALRRRYAAIGIDEAMGSQRARNAAATVLDGIARDLGDR